MASYGSARQFALMVAVAIAVFVGLDVVDFWTSVVGVQAGSYQENSSSLAAIGAGAAFAWFLIAIPACFVAIALWFNRAYRNLPALGQVPGVSPGFAVGSLFIPFVNLVVPFRTLRTIADGSGAKVPRWLPATWWSCWVVGVVVGWIQFFLSISRGNGPPSVWSPLLSIPADVLQSVAGVLLAILVWRITLAQEARVALAPR